MQPFYTVTGFSPKVSLGYLLRRVYKLSLLRLEEALGEEDLSITQWIVLALLANGLASTGRDLSRDMGHDRGAMTRLLDQLEERGLLTRTRDDEDRRICNLRLTDDGLALMHGKTGTIVDTWNDILKDMDRAEVAQMIATLTKLLERLESDPAHVES